MEVTAANQIGRANSDSRRERARRYASPLNAGRQFGSASCAPRFVSAAVAIMVVRRMRSVHVILAVWICLFTSGCHPFWNPAGARAITYEQFETIYYQTSGDRTKGYLFFSQPKLLIVGMSLSTKWDSEAEKYAVSFGGVSDTTSHRSRYDTASLLRATRTNSLWMMQFDIGVGTHGKPGDEFWMYYESKDSPWGIRIPYKGTKRD